MKLKAVIIDDELHSIETLRFDLDRCAKDRLEVVGTFQGMKEALPSLKSLQPDIIFSDIDMPLINGIEGIGMAQLEKTKVVFITAYRQFALDAIKVGAYDYLLKPVQLKELDQLVQRVYEEFQSAGLQVNPLPERMAVSTAEGIEVLPVEDIIFIKAESNYAVFYLRGERQITLGKPLKHFLTKVPAYFLRIHQSYLINTHQIIKYLHKDGGSLLLNEDHLLPVSKSYKEEVKSILTKLL